MPLCPRPWQTKKIQDKQLQRKRFLLLLLNVAVILMIASWRTAGPGMQSIVKMRPRIGSIRRIRPSVDDVALYLDDQKFKRTFRMSRAAFGLLLDLCATDLNRDAVKAANSSEVLLLRQYGSQLHSECSPALPTWTLSCSFMCHILLYTQYFMTLLMF